METTLEKPRQAPTSAAPQAGTRRRKRRDPAKVLFVLPAFVVVIALLIYPVVSSIFFAFTDRHLLRQVYEFVGIDNFLFVLQNDAFWEAFRVSIFWTIGSIAGQLAVGFLLAMALERIPRLSGLFRTLLIIPWAFPAIVIAFTWKWILNDVYGFLPNLLTSLGFTEANVSFLSNPNIVFGAVMLINIWFGAPLFMVNILAALKTVPKDQQEAARVDGASAVQRFRFITFPHISKVIGLLLILRTIWVFNNFELLFLLTGGGPAALTTTLPIFAYRTGWGLYQLGMASAITVLLLLFLLALASLAFRYINRSERRNG